MDSKTWYTLLVALVVLERGLELLISRRNRIRLLARGGFEVGRGHYPWMVVIHATLPVACLWEVWALDRPFLPLLGTPMALLIVATMVMRYWVVATLEERWTTRVVVLPGAPLIRSGPYRWLDHPNYLAVALEVAALPLIHSAWISALLYSVANALVLRTRLAVENQALRDPIETAGTS
jgi:methyltransferase